MKNVTILGGTGLLGSALTQALVKAGYHVNILTRSQRTSDSEQLTFHQYNPAQNEWPLDVIANADIVVNLAGESIGEKRLSEKVKRSVYNSRIETTKGLVTILNSGIHKCKLLIQGSAVGYYGYDRGDEPLNEDADPGLGFLADLCTDWEKEAQKVEGMRLVILRTGVVLDKEKGAYPRLKTPVLLGVGAALASGKQFIPWIHIHDMIRIIRFAMLNEKIEGVVNAVAPNPLRNRRMTGAIANSLNKTLFLPNVPSFVLHLVLGEFAEAVIGGLNVVPDKLSANGFDWDYPEIDSAIKNINWNK